MASGCRQQCTNVCQMDGNFLMFPAPCKRICSIPRSWFSICMETFLTQFSYRKQEQHSQTLDDAWVWTHMFLVAQKFLTGQRSACVWPQLTFWAKTVTTFFSGHMDWPYFGSPVKSSWVFWKCGEVILSKVRAPSLPIEKLSSSVRTTWILRTGVDVSIVQ